MQQQLTIGTLLRGGTYKIEKVLGQGSFGITYLAEHTSLNRKVAIKEFFMKEVNSRGEDGSITGISDGSLSYNYCRKFQKEAINLSHLDHPNIVRVTDSFSENGTFYYVMDYIDGQNLNDYVKTHHVDTDEAVSIIKAIADALIYMHETQHMLHLDIKPGNIMRRASDGHIFLIDFGLSKHYDTNGQPETSTNIGLGTVGYAPIEQGNQAKSGEFRPTIDVYALGATLYKLLTRETPPNASELVSDDELLENNLRAKDVPENLITVVKKAMCPNVRKRTQTVRDFKNNIVDVKAEKQTMIDNTSDSTINGIDVERTIIVSPDEQETTYPEVKSEDAEESESSEGDPNVESVEEEPMKYSIFSFKGRVGRMEYWVTLFGGMLVCLLPLIIMGGYAGVNFSNSLFAFAGMLWAFLYYYIAYAVGAKRCHDLEHSGWYQIIPFYCLFMLFAPGDEGDNEYGKENDGISMDSLKNLGKVVLIAFVIFGIIGMSSRSSNARTTSNSYQNVEADTVATQNITNVAMNLAGADCIYSGEAVEDADYECGYLPHGMGQATFDDGRYYKGHFTYGEMDGSDAYFSYPNGDVYVGSFANSQFKQGKYTVHATGEEFVGMFKNGQPHKGTWYDKNGNVIETI